MLSLYNVQIVHNKKQEVYCLLGYLKIKLFLDHLEKKALIYQSALFSACWFMRIIVQCSHIVQIVNK